MTTIEINRVSKKLKGSLVVDDVSMKLESGRIVGFRGVNGSGKTMLMRLICGLITPTEGEIRIDGQVLGKDLTFPKSVGVLIENPAFLDHYSGFENLRMLASIHQLVDESRVHQVLQEVGLNPDDKKKYRKYSLGMKQRLGIACALLEHPALVVLDEPTNALDAEGIERTKELIRKERDRGALVVLSCHDATILEDLADETYELYEGKVVNHITDLQ